MSAFTRITRRVTEWRDARAEDPFRRGYREHVQKVAASLIPLGQLGRRTEHAISVETRPGQPGRLTVRVGDETATVDPLDPGPKFLRDMAAADRLLDRVARGETLPAAKP